jgi:hypothetical protein
MHLVSVMTGKEITYHASTSSQFLHIFLVGVTVNCQHFTQSPFLTLDKNFMFGGNIPSSSQCQSHDLMFPNKDENEKEDTCTKMQSAAETSTKTQEKYKTLPLQKTMQKLYQQSAGTHYTK